MSPTPTGFSCPRCGTPNFTWRGLLGHVCEGRNRQTGTPAPAHAQVKRRLTPLELARARQQ